LNARMGLKVREVDPEVLRLFDSYDWPGNVRELENTMERAIVLCGGEVITVVDLPEKLRSHGARKPEGREAAIEPGDLSIKRASRRSEEDLIKRALLRTRGNRTRAAELLEISHRALLYKIKEYGVVINRDSVFDAEEAPMSDVTPPPLAQPLDDAERKVSPLTPQPGGPNDR